MTADLTKVEAPTEIKVFPLKSVVLAKLFDISTGLFEWRRAEIIEHRPLKNIASPECVDDYDYYVHYIKYNRRLDWWLKYEDIRPLSNLPNCKLRNIYSFSENVEEINRIAQQIEDELEDSEAEHEGLDKSLLEQHKECTKVKTIQKIQLGPHLLDAWYFSPFPKEYQDRETLYFCEFCLSFFCEPEELVRHSRRCTVRFPPGDEIYRDGHLSVFEIDGYLAKAWCENLCFLAKLFLDHKTLQFDTEPFLFYVLCEFDARGWHLVGYFSKEKFSREEYNLACILTLPQHQRKGYGKFLISFSYELSLREQRFGTPERPLSDLGRASYRSWWIGRILEDLEEQHNRGLLQAADVSNVVANQMSNRSVKGVSLNSVSRRTGIVIDDLKTTLTEVGVLRFVQGQHILILTDTVKKKLEKLAGRPGIPVKPEKLRWVPFILTTGTTTANPTGARQGGETWIPAIGGITSGVG